MGEQQVYLQGEVLTALTYHPPAQEISIGLLHRLLLPVRFDAGEGFLFAKHHRWAPWQGHRKSLRASISQKGGSWARRGLSEIPMGVMNQFQVPLLEGQRIVDEAKASMNGQAKQFRYVMSHVTGKIEILGRPSCEEMLFKYHQAKDGKDDSRFFTVNLAEDQCWLPNDVR